MFRFAAFLIAFMLAAPIVQATPLVTAQWLVDNPAGADRVVLDLRGQRAYAAGHIPGAVQTNYGGDGWRMRINGVPGMLPVEGPGLARLVKHIGQLGIDNNTHVVLVAPGQSAGDMGMATRLYWSFKVLGHDLVSVLDGGMAGWIQDERPLQSGSQTNSPVTFVPAVRSDMLIDRAAVRAVQQAGGGALDARPTRQYMGLQKSGSVAQAGTFPGAVSLPGYGATKGGGGYFHSADMLKNLLTQSKAKAEEDLFVFCNTGHWASLTWFMTSELLGHKNLRLYDGSLADWTQQPGVKLELKSN